MKNLKFLFFWSSKSCHCQFASSKLTITQSNAFNFLLTFSSIIIWIFIRTILVFLQIHHASSCQLSSQIIVVVSWSSLRDFHVELPKQMKTNRKLLSIQLRQLIVLQAKLNANEKLLRNAQTRVNEKSRCLVQELKEGDENLSATMIDVSNLEFNSSSNFWVFSFFEILEEAFDSFLDSLTFFSCIFLWVFLSLY